MRWGAVLFWFSARRLFSSQSRRSGSLLSGLDPAVRRRCRLPDDKPYGYGGCSEMLYTVANDVGLVGLVRGAVAARGVGFLSSTAAFHISFPLSQ